MNKKILLSLGFSALLASSLLAKESVSVFHAGSLAVPFAEIEKAFESKYPQYDVQREASGSIAAARKISEIGRAADVMASADYKVIDNLLIPKDAKFNVQFATNEMAIAYTSNAKYAKEINAQNWPEIFLRDGVKVGHSNPNLDPCGYRTMLVTKLAEKHYKSPGLFDKLFGYGESYKVGDEKKSKIIVRPKETDLLGLMEANAYDYLYIYKSVAQQHGLKYIELPKEVSLVDNEFKNFYKTVSFKISGKKPGLFVTKYGGAMVYGITVVENNKSPKNKDGAIKFVNFVLSDEGKKIMASNGQGTFSSPTITGDASIIGK
ncbi:ABC-type molybdate transport system, periplasmic component [Sulfurimonas gotlandica GD1]|jgi:molybdate/tungstate transport system substrate-binding protein|uniref:ABC-type molybdate transport system, periplasmic component n=1 Tax=Sulfurimonas gotlandica (strain DSM 19862 / JCM 16533 / GD1) TaxID=929558 RepID=B6BLJ8_SULGG|nr:tungstate ABC transporter substrate-binding protein WtpA [Sulfurimonas gotlandica]EDZ61966.1 ABC-type molybdate transport system, periplasmic component [Sulfurimonas gotlandica GD1]EHP28655.1 ABC-type molybdate transport system, periplasmic component [Sulfurimonas gotlandica GD1]